MNSREIVNYVEIAAGESAYEMYSEYKSTGQVWDEKFSKAIKEMKSKRVKDIGGALADKIYNDKGFLCDMIGDKVYESGSNKDERLKILAELKEMRNFDTWREAIKELEENIT